MTKEAPFVPASPRYRVVKKTSTLEAGLPRMKWRQRWKTDFLFTHPEYGVKTTGQALAAFFSPFRSPPDVVAYRFVRDGRHLYTKPINNLVMAVRGLSSKNYKNAHQHMRRIPLFNTIIQVIRDWDVETIERELDVLQREPRSRTFGDFGPLTVALVKPLFKLVRLNPHVHLLPALAKMYESAKMYLTNQAERDKLQQFYSIARDELSIVFAQVRPRMYPVLLKLLANKFVERDQFFLEYEPEILAFLGLREEDLVQDQPEAEAVQVTPPPPAWAPEPDRVPGMAQQGLLLLDKLFPRSGWNNLAANPDLFSYFQTVFDYPKGSDLLPVDDPLQVILPLSEILQHLFYGFQNIHWGTTKTSGGAVVSLPEVVEKRIARWHFFHEEFFGKNYLPLLQEYCREVERAGPLSTEAKRHEHQLLWFQRNYLLPNKILPIMDDVRVKTLGYPNLPIQVREMLELLAPIAIEVERLGSKSTALQNPEARVRFPVANLVSQRFQSILKSDDTAERATNRTLVFFTLALLSTLDDLISRPNSQLYRREPKHLFRTAGDDKPVYNAPKRNSLGLLKKLNEAPPTDSLVDAGQLDLGRHYGPFQIAEAIRAQIVGHQEDKKPFVLVAFRVWTEGSEGEFEDFTRNEELEGPPLHQQDDGTWVGVMPNMDIQGAERYARILLGMAAQRIPPLALGGLVVPYSPHWTLEKLQSAPAKGWVEAAEVVPQALGVWNHTSQAFDFRSDVPTVQLPVVPEPEPTPEAPVSADPEETTEEPGL